jgi:hypothetical protein
MLEEVEGSSMSNRIRVALFVALILGVVFAYGASPAIAKSPKEDTPAQSPKEDTAAQYPKEETAARNPKEDAAAQNPTGDVATQSPKEDTAAQNPTGETAAQNPTEDMAQTKPGEYTDTFPPEPYSSTGTNPYFKLEPGYRLVLKGKEEGKMVNLAITVLDETKVVDGVETRVVEERETKNGRLSEISKNYFATGQQTNNVYYFGEDVDFYNKKGKVVNHEGSWLSGVDGARYGLIMPGTVEVGQRYYQEVAPGVALDRAEHVSKSADVNTPAGRFRNTLKVRETTPLEPDVEEFKWYAHGVGLVKSGLLKLRKYVYLGT